MFLRNAQIHVQLNMQFSATIKLTLSWKGLGDPKNQFFLASREPDACRKKGTKWWEIWIKHIFIRKFRNNFYFSVVGTILSYFFDARNLFVPGLKGFGQQQLAPSMLYQQPTIQLFVICQNNIKLHDMEFNEVCSYVLWLVVDLPLWKIFISQWEGWHPIYETEKKMFETTNQFSYLLILSCMT